MLAKTKMSRIENYDNKSIDQTVYLEEEEIKLRRIYLRKDNFYQRSWPQSGTNWHQMREIWDPFTSVRYNLPRTDLKKSGFVPFGVNMTHFVTNLASLHWLNKTKIFSFVSTRHGRTI